MKLVKLYFIILVLVSTSFFNCTEQFTLTTESFEDVLVVEATITNELKTQVVKLSRTFLLESNTQIMEINANVEIIDNNQNTFEFTETEDGVYTSNIPFQAIEGISYKLLITTANNKKYESRNEFIASSAQIDSLYADIETVNDKLGIQIFADSNDDLGLARFFRYEYEETYKIVAPLYNSFDAYPVMGNSLSYDIEFTPRPENQQVCYTTKHSNEILITNVNDLSENKIERFPIRFIPIDNAIIRDRYSILVRQYVQSAEANNFYKILKELGAGGSVLIDSQPGFVQGNMFPLNNPNEKVIGFFDVTSVTSKRIYFNHSDFNLDTPPYFYECDLIMLDYNIASEPTNERQLLYQLLVFNGYKYVNYDGTSIYTIVEPQCGDCSIFSSNIRPEFWID